MNMWFKRENKNSVNGECKVAENGVAGKLRRKKAIINKSTRESSERDTCIDIDKEKRRHSDIMDIKVSLDRREESEESTYESAENSDPISASDDALPRLGRLQIGSRESIKLAVTDEECEGRRRRSHRKNLSLSNPLEMVKNLGDEWLEAAKREMDKSSDRKKSKESLWSEEDRDSMHGSNAKLNERKGGKRGGMEPPKAKKVGALSIFRRRKKVETVSERDDRATPPREVIAATGFFLEAEKRHAIDCEAKLIVRIPLGPDLPEEAVDSDEESDVEDESEERAAVKVGAPRRRLSRTISRSKSKARGKSQTVLVNTLRKSQSGTLKRAKKKNAKALTRSRTASTVETPLLGEKNSDSKSAKWPFGGSVKGDARREGSADDRACADSQDPAQEQPLEKDDKDGVLWRSLATPGGKPVNRAESCREPAASGRRGKQRNASDPNKLTAKAYDCEPGTGAGAPSGSSSSSSLSSRSNESGAPAADHHASQSDWSEEEEPLAEQWSSSVTQQIVDTLSARLRKRQELIHELITSESSHVRWLKVLQTVFLRPLERGEHGQMLTGDEVKALFPNLPAVRERHNRLYSDLKVLRKGDCQLVQIRPLADAMLNTLGDASYAPCLSRFCRGQRMALDALRERRRKNKDLHQFLSSKEALPLCGRLQLRDLVAVVWQRLTKYQLLLEGVLKTVSEEDDDCEEDSVRLRLALDTAKDVLHRVDTAIRTAENEHRLRSIQSKLEVRGGPGGDLEEMRRLDLTQHKLLFEGDLSIRTDTNKKSNVLALLMAECLILLQREGEKFILKQVSSMLTPIIKWSTVLFRPNAAVKNTFFLMNINCVQMYELSANSASEYNAWTKYISEAPLAEARAGRAPSLQHNREKNDDSSGVSRNASDASRTSASSAPEEPEPASTPEKADPPTEREKTPEKTKEETTTKEEEPKPKLTMNGRITTHEFDPPPLTTAVHVETTATAQFASRAVSAEERLRRLDESISRALKAKSALVAELLGVPSESYAAVADLAVAEALDQVEVDARVARLEREDSVDAELPPGFSGSGVHQLLLAAQAQANQLTEALSRALNVTESDVIAARHYAPWRETSGLCDSCTKRRTRDKKSTDNAQRAAQELDRMSRSIDEEDAHNVTSGSLETSTIEKEVSFDMLSELERQEEKGDVSERALDSITLEEIGESSTDPVTSAGGAYDSVLSTRLVPLACGLQGVLAKLLHSLPSIEEERARLRRELAAERDAHDSLRRIMQGLPTNEEIESPPLESMDQNGQDQTNSGG